jgi:hypothetical protein
MTTISEALVHVNRGGRDDTIPVSELQDRVQDNDVLVFPTDMPILGKIKLTGKT